MQRNQLVIIAKTTSDLNSRKYLKKSSQRFRRVKAGDEAYKDSFSFQRRG